MSNVLQMIVKVIICRRAAIVFNYVTTSIMFASWSVKNGKVRGIFEIMKIIKVYDNGLGKL